MKLYTCIAFASARRPSGAPPLPILNLPKYIDGVEEWQYKLNNVLGIAARGESKYYLQRL